MNELWNISQTASALGVSRTAVQKAIKSGRLVESVVTGDDGFHKIRAELVRDEWKRNTHPIYQANQNPPGTMPVLRRGRGRPPKPKPAPVEVVVSSAPPAPQVVKSSAPPPPPPPPRRAAPVQTVPAAPPPAPASSGAPLGTPDYNTSRAIREAYAARTARLEYEEMAGKLVDADKVRAEAFKLGRTVRDAILNIAERVAAQVAAEPDPHKCYVILTKELNDALSALAGPAKEQEQKKTPGNVG